MFLTLNPHNLGPSITVHKSCFTVTWVKASAKLREQITLFVLALKSFRVRWWVKVIKEVSPTRLAVVGERRGGGKGMEERGRRRGGEGGGVKVVTRRRVEVVERRQVKGELGVMVMNFDPNFDPNFEEEEGFEIFKSELSSSWALASVWEGEEDSERSSFFLPPTLLTAVVPVIVGDDEAIADILQCKLCWCRNLPQSQRLIDRW